jgi:hypothetical protein
MYKSGFYWVRCLDGKLVVSCYDEQVHTWTVCGSEWSIADDDAVEAKYSYSKFSREFAEVICKIDPPLDVTAEMSAASP